MNVNLIDNGSNEKTVIYAQQAPSEGLKEEGSNTDLSHTRNPHNADRESTHSENEPYDDLAPEVKRNPN